MRCPTISEHNSAQITTLRFPQIPVHQFKLQRIQFTEVRQMTRAKDINVRLKGESMISLFRSMTSCASVGGTKLMKIATSIFKECGE